MVNPRPTVNLDGAPVSCETVLDDHGRQVFPATGATAIEGFTIVWGRSDQWTQPEPSVLSLSLWEAAPGVWLDRILTQRAARRPASVVFMRGGSSPGEVKIFSGWITNVDVVQEKQLTPLGRIPGFRVSIQASDRTAFLGNINWDIDTLPEGNMQARAVRIRNRAAKLGIRQFYFEDRFSQGSVKAVPCRDMSVLDAVNGMYQSFADQWYYHPHRNVVNRIPTGSNWGAYTLRLGVSNGDNAVRLYPPMWADPTGQEDPIDQQAYPAAYIGAGDVTGDIALSTDMVCAISEISCKWFNRPGGKDHTTTVKARDDAHPESRLEFESWFDDGVYIDPVIEDVRRMVTGDGVRPVHPEIRWDTNRSGDIPDWPTFESLTCPAQTIRMVCLAGDPFSAAMNAAPVWHPCGGTIAYRAGHWDIATSLAPTAMPLPANHVPLTPAGIDTRITLADTEKWHIDKSITPFDLYYVSNSNGSPGGYN